jgi:2-keto-3-deoxy-L-rhamnonate aldolase RhmA
VADVVVPSDKVLGIYAGNAAMTAEWLERGARYFTTGMEILLRDGMTTHLERVRG